MTEHDTLDGSVNSGGPRVTPRSAELDDAIRSMSSAAARESRAGRRGLRPSVAWSLAAALILGGGASAVAAADAWDWHPWALTPDATFEVTFPSGITCELRYGDVESDSPETAAAVRAFVAENDIIALADVDGAIARARAAGQSMYDENDVPQPAGPGTTMYNADFEYQMALGMAVKELITEYLQSEGLPIHYGAAMQGDCIGHGE